jgi:hypothetical protein
MAASNWDVFMPDTLVFAPSAPDPYVRQALCRAARELCQRTYVWREWVACVKAVSPVSQYSFTLPTDSELIRFEKVTLDGVPVDVIDWKAGWRDPVTYAADNEKAATSNDLVTFTLSGGEVTGTVKAFVSLMPSRLAATAPELLVGYLETIAHGAAAILCATPGAMFENKDVARRMRDAFEDDIGSAGADTFRGQRGQQPRSAVNWF